MENLQVARYFSILDGRSRSYVLEACRPLKITYSEYILLLRLFDCEGASQEELSRTLQTDKSAVARTLKIADTAVADAGLSAQAIDGVVLVGGATRMPVIRQAVASHFGKPPYTGLDPDQVVALGAAMQAAQLIGQRRDGEDEDA